MCQKHDPKPLYLRPDPKTQSDLFLGYVLRGLASKIVCASCGLTGCVTSFGNVRWFTPGKVGYLMREQDLARAGEWNAKVQATTPAAPVEG